MSGLIIVETHPVQYHAPVWRALCQEWGVPIHVVYGADFSVRGYRDQEFGADFQWDVDLMLGYNSTVLHPSSEGGPGDYQEVTAEGLTAVLESLQPEAIVALGYHHPLDRAAIRWARMKCVPLLFRGEVSDVAQPQRSWWRGLLRDAILRRLYRQCVACLYLGERAREHYLRLGVTKAQLLHSPYCVDVSPFQTEESDRDRLRVKTRRQWGIPEDAWVIAFSGKFSHRKGVDLLPLALCSMPSEWRENATLLFIGDGELREDLKLACVSLNAVFTGFQNQTQLSPFYHAADVLVLPSRWGETWGLVVNDALHHGLPCIVSDNVGCAPDLVIPGITGEKCVPGDAESLKAAMARSYDLKGGHVRLQCREHVAAYSVSRAAQGIARGWERIIAERKA